MWSRCRFERHLFDKLEAEFGETGAEKHITAYNQAKVYLCGNVYREIALKEPGLTRHDATHVVAVMDRIADLILPGDAACHSLTTLDLYALAMATLFHDVGNIDGRNNHPSAPVLSSIYTSARGDSPEAKRERTVVLSVVRAHGGVASDGTADTLKELSEQGPLHSKVISLRAIGALLRFADELAEGPERTSEFCRKNRLYAEDGQRYHDYASITHVTVDVRGGRVLLNYEIEVSDGCSSECVVTDGERHCLKRWNTWLGNLVEFVYGRIGKLDQERKYARYYTDELSTLVATEASMNFTWHGQPVLMDSMRPNPLRLDEMVVPGSPAAEPIPDVYPAYERTTLIDAINKGIDELESP